MKIVHINDSWQDDFFKIGHKCSCVAVRSMFFSPCSSCFLCVFPKISGEYPVGVVANHGRNLLYSDCGVFQKLFGCLDAIEIQPVGESVSGSFLEDAA